MRIPLQHAAPAPTAQARRPVIQTKPRIGSVDDPFEREADRIADDVVADRPVAAISAMPLGTPQRTCAECEAEEEEESVQRKCAGCTAGEPMSGQSADQAANAVAQGGRPLTAEQRAYFEPRFGRDFSKVRVHSHGGASDAARAIDARAYTLGSNIAFDAGAYDGASPAGRRLLAHELVHVVQQEQAGTDAATVRRQHRQGAAVTTPREQQRRFIEAFNANPQAALADVANLLEIGGGQFEVYGLVYVDNETGRLEIIRMLTAEHRAIFDQVRRLRARQVADVDLELDETRSLLQLLDRMTGIEAWMNNLSIRPGRALAVLARVQAELDAGRQGYPAVSDGDLGNVESAIETFSHSHAFPIPIDERPRPEGRTLLGYFHTHPTTLQPSGIRGVPSAGGDIGVATEEGQGSFLITGTPDQPLIYFIADGKYWDLTNGLRNALDRQVSFVAGFDRALGGAFGELALGAEGFGVRARASERPGLRISQGFNIGDYRLTLAGELNPAIASGDFALRGTPETRRLVEASPLAGELEFSFRNQPFIPGSVSLQVLSGGAVRVEGRIDPIPVPMDLEFVGGATLFEGVAGLESEGFVGVEMRPGLPLPLLPGGVGFAGRYVPGDGLNMNVFYENPWMRVDYALPSTSGAEGGVFSTSFNYRLPTGTLRVQLGYGDQLFGSIGYQVHLR